MGQRIVTEPEIKSVFIHVSCDVREIAKHRKPNAGSSRSNAKAIKFYPIRVESRIVLIDTRRTKNKGIL